MEVKSLDRLIKVLEIFLIIDVLTCTFFSGMAFQAKEFPFNYKVTTSAISDCQNDSLVNSVKCLQSNFSSWFFYNITNTAKELNDTELKEYGGVCSHASKWYIEQAEALGYYGKEITFYGNQNIGHEIALVYTKDMKEYCLIDQYQIVGCERTVV